MVVEQRGSRALNGWLDLRVFQHMAVAQGVAGGSLIYANISAVPDESASSRLAAGDHLGGDGAPLQNVGRVMNVQPVPDNQWSKKTTRWDAAEAIARRPFQKLRLAVTFDPEWTIRAPPPSTCATKRHQCEGVEQGTCVHLGNCDIGCEVDARNTLDRNYLALAERKGADAPAPRHQHRAGRAGLLSASIDRAGRRTGGSAQAPGGACRGSMVRPSCCALPRRVGYAAERERTARAQLEQQRRFPDARALPCPRGAPNAGTDYHQRHQFPGW